MRWEDVAEELAFDGGFLDVVVFDVDIGHWRRLYDAIGAWGPPRTYFADRVHEVDAPRTVDEIFHLDERGLLLLQVGGLELHCHFYDDNRIEFDLDPREFQGQAELDALLSFLRLVADATGREAVLVPEGLEWRHRILSVPPGLAPPELGPWRSG